MNKRIRNRMYKNIAFLIFLLLTVVTATFTNKTEACDLPNDTTQMIKAAPGP